MMSQDTEFNLRRSLDAVDRHRWRMLVTVGVAAALTLFAFLRLGGAFKGDAGNVARLLQLSIVALVFWTSSLAFVIVLQLTVATKRILRAIELASRRE